jgi:acyl-coenzyme A thioesterase PaaI-like protein
VVSGLAEHVSGRARLALAVPLAAAVGAELLDERDPQAGVAFTVGGLTDDGGGFVHASALAGVLELAGQLALIPYLTPDEHAVTRTLGLQLMAAPGTGALVAASGEVDRRGRRLAFVTATATVAGQVVARAQLVQSVVPSG